MCVLCDEAQERKHRGVALCGPRGGGVVEDRRCLLEVVLVDEHVLESLTEQRAASHLHLGAGHAS